MIRKAQLSDIDGIYDIFQSNVLDITKLNDFSYQERLQREGFIIGNDTKDDFLQFIRDYPYFFIYEENKKILGFIYGQQEKEYNDDQNKFWLDTRAKNLYYNDPTSFCIGMIVLAKDQHRKGIAKQLMQYFEKKVKEGGYKYIFSMVRMLPLTNCASIIFHAKNQYKRIAAAKPIHFLGIENMSAFLYFKEL